MGESKWLEFYNPKYTSDYLEILFKSMLSKNKRFMTTQGVQLRQKLAACDGMAVTYNPAGEKNCKVLPKWS
jgi:hypothetical protein